MGLRFRKSFKLFPGVRLNVSGGGVSTSFGVPGAMINVGKRGVRGTVGIPGSGLSYSEMLVPAGGRRTTNGGEPAVWTPRAPTSPQPSPQAYIEASAMREIGSASVDRLTTAGLLDLKQMLVDARQQRREVDDDLGEARKEYASRRGELDRKERSLFKPFFKKRIAALGDLVPEAQGEVERLEAWSEATHVDMDFATGERAESAYAALVRAFEQVAGSKAIWDITADRDTDRVAERSAACRTLDRKPVAFDFASSDLVRFQGKAMRFGNANGDPMLIYPGMILMPRADGVFALLDLREVRLDASPVRFIESERIPDDAQVVDRTWAKVNKNGTPDRRFADNHEIPVVRYGQLKFSTASGLNEEYQVSNAEGALAFGRALDAYKAALG